MTDQQDIEILKAIIARPSTSKEKSQAEAYLLWLEQNRDKMATDPDFDMENWPEIPLRLTSESMKSVDFESLKPKAQRAFDQAVARRDKIQDDLQGVAFDDDDNPLWSEFEEAKDDVLRLYGEWLDADRGYTE